MPTFPDHAPTEEIVNAAEQVLAGCKPMTRREIAARLAADIPEGWYVYLGIGAPLQVADYVPEERGVGRASGRERG